MKREDGEERVKSMLETRRFLFEILFVSTKQNLLWIWIGGMNVTQ